jgi:hypothetical protein
MQTFTVGASSLQVSEGLCNALSGFDPEVSGGEFEGYQVTVRFGNNDRQIVAILDALGRHVTERHSGPARVELDGRSYMIDPE